MNIKNSTKDLEERKDEFVMKAVQIKSVEELNAFVNEDSKKLSKEAATELFTSLETMTGKLSDDELDSVAGGAAIPSTAYGVCNNCNTGVEGIWDFDMGAYYYVCPSCKRNGRFKK